MAGPSLKGTANLLNASHSVPLDLGLWEHCFIAVVFWTWALTLSVSPCPRLSLYPHSLCDGSVLELLFLHLFDQARQLRLMNNEVFIVPLFDHPHHGGHQKAKPSERLIRIQSQASQ